MLMRVRELKRDEFARTIKNGMGSAFLHVCAYGDEGVQEELLRSCLTNHIFDRQCENARNFWLARMLDRTGRLQFYADEIYGALEKLPEDAWDFTQLVWLAFELFERGQSKFQELLLAVFEQACSKYEEPTEIVHVMLEVAGLRGFEIAARWMGTHAPHEDYEIHRLYERAVYLHYENVVEHVFTSHAGDSGLHAFRDVVMEFKAAREKTYVPDPPLMLSEVFQRIDAATDFKLIGGLRGFGKHASESELREICQRLKAETDPSRQYAYLEVFGARQLPEVDDSLLVLTESMHKRVRRSALSVLSKTKSPAIRQYALRLVESNCESKFAVGLELLEASVEPGDTELFLEKFPLIQDEEMFHSVAFTVRELAEQFPAEPSRKLLLYIYEFVRCSSCREYVLSDLLERNFASQSLLFEAQWDVNDKVRMLARGAIKTE
jgi:hypothetical protein